MSELSGRTFLVTGGNTGIGLAIAKDLVARGGRVYIACRSAAKGKAAAAAIGGDSVFPLLLDLADLDSVRACAASFLALDEPLHVLINNAGLAGRQGLTEQGFELLFGVNHLGHFALTMALLGRLQAADTPRIVNVSSDAQYAARGIDWTELRRRGHGIGAMHQYAVSKLCNVLFTQELARREPGIASYAVHPGMVASDIWRRVPWPVRPLIKTRMLSVDDGAKTPLYCATSPEVAGESGLFYDKCAHREPSRAATPELAAELWRRSEEWTE
jgi:retinol dehydrogenase 12